MRKFYFLFLLSALVTVNKATAQAGTNLSYDGVDDYLFIPDAGSSSILSSLNGDFTIEAWVYFKGGADWQRILDFGNDPNNYVFLTAQSANGSSSPRFAIVESGIPQVLDAAVPLTPNAWTHIAVTLDNATNTASIYINGNLAGTNTSFSFRPADLGVTVNNWLARSEFGGDPFYNGYIEEFRVSNNVRYTANFTPQTTEFAPDANTVALYHFNEGTGQTTADATGNNPAGILGGTLAVEASDPAWITGSVLPIRLGEFYLNIDRNNTQVEIRWSASIDRPSEFIIERSNNGRDFSPIGSINQSNASGSFESYNYRDLHPLTGRSYYRLKLAEAGSAAYYSRTIPVNFSMRDQLLVYPNPLIGNQINFELMQPYTGEVKVVLLNASGSVILDQKIQAVNRREFQINRSNLQSGTYLLEVTTNGQKRSQMIVCK